MASSPPAKDPRYRPFRAVSWTVYLVISVGFSVLVTGSVIRSVWAMEPKTLPPGPPLAADACRDQARRLLDELEQQRVALAASPSPHRVELDWVPFRNDWAARFHQVKGQCVDGSRERAGLAALFDELEDASSRYTVIATQFAQQMGPGLERLREKLDGGVTP